MLRSAVANEAVSSGGATRDDLEDLSRAWRAWADHPDRWWLVPPGEIICRA